MIRNPLETQYELIREGWPSLFFDNELEAYSAYRAHADAEICPLVLVKHEFLQALWPSQDTTCAATCEDGPHLQVTPFDFSAKDLFI